MLVPMAVVVGVAVAVMDVVDMVAMGDRFVTTARAVFVIAVILDNHVFGRHTLVPVAVVFAMSVSVMDVVDMVAMGDRFVTTARAMFVWVVFMHRACGSHGDVLRFGRGRQRRPRCG